MGETNIQGGIGVQTLGRERRDQILREKATEMEGQFLAEMLGHAGFGKSMESFGGGIGEEQFSSFLRQEQAMAIARKGGIGLAEHLFNAMKARADVAR